MASASSTARLSPHPDTVACMRAPPMSSRVVISPMTISAMRGDPEVHRGVALDHDHDVAEARDVGTARRRRPEEAADLGHAPRQLHLVVEDPSGAAAAREELDLVGDAGPGGVDQPEDGELVPQRVLGGAHHLLDRACAPRPGLDGGVVGDHHHGPPLDPAHAGDHAVGRQVGGRGVGQQRVLDERVRVEEACQPVADEELVLLGELVGAAGEVAVERPGGRRSKRGGVRVGLVGGGIGHGQLRRIARMATSSDSAELAKSRAASRRDLHSTVGSTPGSRRSMLATRSSPNSWLPLRASARPSV